MASSTRDILLSTTAALLERRGYSGTGLSQIVQESGAPRGSLYYHFPGGKEELAAEALAQRGRVMAQHVRAELARHDDPAQAVRQFIRGLAVHFEAGGCSGGAPIAGTALEAAATSPPIQRACYGAYESLRAAFRELLEQAGHSPVRADRLATTLTAAIEGAIVLARAAQDAAPLRDVAEELAVLVAA